YLDKLEDGTRVCKVCDKSAKVEWGPFMSISTITRHFERKHPSIFKEFQKPTKI
ncbi:24128_t:CDS:1, partial [Racocetra persica]